MYITKELLRKKGACKDGIEWFENQFPEGAELNEENIAKIAECNSEFAWWLYNNVVQSKLLYQLCGVIDSEGVNRSKGVNCSKGVADSEGVDWSNGVDCSRGVASSNGVDWSAGVADSNGVDCSKGVNRSRGVADSEGVDWSTGVATSRGVAQSNGVANSFGIYRCSGVSNALFCANKLPEYSVFGALVERERFEEIQKELFEKLGDWRPVFHIKRNNRQIELTNQQAWSGMPKKAIQYVKSLPEYNAEMFYTITGIL